MSTLGQTFRMTVIALIFGVAFFGIGAKLTWLHFGNHEVERARFERIVTTKRVTAGIRGNIVDREGDVLAMDVQVKHVAVDPKYVAANGNSMAAATRLAYLLDLDRDRVRTILNQTEREFVYLKKNVSFDVALAVENLGIKGVITRSDTFRQYPKKSLASHIIGFANTAGQGSAGVEQTKDAFVQGKGGLIEGVKAAGQRELRGKRSVDIAAERGGDVTITLNQHLQYEVEEALKLAVETNQALAAWATVIETRTGRVLAMASMPDYDLNQYRVTPAESMRNRALAMVYEPGSIMKPISMAIALEEGVTHREEVIDCEGKPWFYLGRPLRDYHYYDELTVWDVLRKSSNIGTAKISIRVGEHTFHDYLTRFGFGSKTGIALPGEEYGIMHSVRSWSKLDLSRICIGHSVSVTQLQMANAVNAIANDGFLMRPYVVERVTDTHGKPVFEAAPEVLARPVSGDTARKVREMMARILAPGGTGTRAAPTDTRFAAAGKTGTAEKLVDGRYHPTKNIASFVGFLPYDDPVITIAVSVDEPKFKRTGGVVAGPVFKQIADRAIEILSIPPGAPPPPDPDDLGVAENPEIHGAG